MTKFRVCVPAKPQGHIWDELVADSVKFWDGGVLAFYDKDANMNVLYRAYAPGRWLMVESEDDK